MILQTLLPVLWSLLPFAVSTPIVQERTNPTSQSYLAAQQFGVYSQGPGFAGPLGANSIGFYFQGDGNFVAYRGTPNAANAVWSSNTGGHSVCSQTDQCHLNFQEDGNLVIYVQGTAIWSTGTGGGTGYEFTMYGSPPYVVIYKSNGQVAYSSGGTSSPVPPCPRGEKSARCNA